MITPSATETQAVGQDELLPPLAYEVAQLFPRQGAWTEADYWPLSEHNRIIELSEGRLILPPMATTEHQDIVGNIYFALRMYIHTHKLGKVAIAPLPVRLWEGKIREPDVIFMRSENLERVQQQHWDVPDLVVEVLSPGTRKTDREEKSGEYAQAGVDEYWIVTPETRLVEVFAAPDTQAGQYARTATYQETMQIESHVLPGLALTVADVFAGEEPTSTNY